MDNTYRTLLGWREDFDIENRFLKQEYIEYKGITYWVSTVDLGLNHNFYGVGAPLYWETMIFVDNDPANDYIGREMYCDRYSSKEQALLYHDLIMKAFENNAVGYDAYDEFDFERWFVFNNKARRVITPIPQQSRLVYHRDYKYQKRVKNRQTLHDKLKKLGRK